MKTKKLADFPTVEKVNSFRYQFTEFNKDGWASAKRHLPIAFDLVTVETSTGKRVAAWWTEFNWDGIRLKKEDVVLNWKRRLYEHIT